MAGVMMPVNGVLFALDGVLGVGDLRFANDGRGRLLGYSAIAATAQFGRLGI
jgi:hypothetical protein